MTKLKSLQHVLWSDLSLSLFNFSPDVQLHFANDKLYMHWFSSNNTKKISKLNITKNQKTKLMIIGFEDLVKLSSSRRSDRVYLGWFVWDLVGRLFRMSIGFPLSTGFQVYLSKCQNSCESRLYVRHDLFSFVVFLPYFSILILSLPLLGMGSKSTSLPGFCVRRSR